MLSMLCLACYHELYFLPYLLLFGILLQQTHKQLVDITTGVCMILEDTEKERALETDIYYLVILVCK